LCEAQQGQVTSAYELLQYLHNTGVVYYQKDLFHNQIILDQRWAIEAIYAIFHRHHALHWLKRVGGRFRRSDLHELVWSDRSEAEQRLFLSFMESCALCFCLSDRKEDDPEYVAPELLPDKATYAEEVALRRQERGDETVWYIYTQRFIHRSVMQRLMVRVGRMFRTRAVYWQEGVCIDVPGTQSMAIIDCERGVGGDPAQGRMTIEVRGRARHDLLNRIRNECERLLPQHQELWQAVSVDGTEWVDVAKLPDARLLGSVVSEQRHKLDAQPFLFLLSKEPHDDLSPTAPFRIEEHPMPPAKGTIYLSYAWGDAQENGASREDIVDRLYASLLADGYTVKRDKMDLEYKGLISTFMADIGRGDCVVVVISDKYLKSPYCMHELLAIYKNNDFRDRICPIVLADAKLRTLEDRFGYRLHWINRLDHLERLIEKIGVRNVSKAEFQEYDMYREIMQHHGTLASHLTDINSQTPQVIEANDFETLKRTIDERLRQLP
jgi:internalin A